jgi:hypothetical protein
MRSKKEIYEQIDLATEADGRYPGMTFEEGVKDALLWVLGDTEDPPMEE